MGRRFHQRTLIAALWLGLICVSLSIGQDSRMVTIRRVVVDQAGMRVSKARVAVTFPGRPKVQAEAPRGEFTVNIPQIGNELTLVAQDQSGQLQGTSQFRARQDGEPIRVTLHKAREIAVAVTDPSNRPIPGARVGVDAGLLRGGTFGEQITDDVGRAVLRFPAEARAESVFAVKRDVGVNFKPISVGPVEAQTIVLGDNAEFQVRVTDDEDKPLAGVSIRPFTMSSGASTPLSTLSLREMDELRVVTDASGLAAFKTIPKSRSRRLQFDAELNGNAAIQRLSYDPAAAPKEITARFAPLVTVRGKVTTADGKPLGRAEIVAAGAGLYQREPSSTSSSGWHADSSSVGFRTYCEADGSFEVSVARNHYYAFIASRGSPAT